MANNLNRLPTATGRKATGRQPVGQAYGTNDPKRTGRAPVGVVYGSNDPKPGGYSRDQIARLFDAQQAINDAGAIDEASGHKGGAPMGASSFKLAATRRRDALLKSFAAPVAARTPATAVTPVSVAATTPSAAATPSAPAVTDPLTDPASPVNPVNQPVAVTDPASQISPEEQAARLRARMLLLGATQRTGGLRLTGGGSLGYRSLTGF